MVVSACLLGVRCNHRGGHNHSPEVEALADRFRLVPVCPETAGGLPAPRPAAELTTRPASDADVAVEVLTGDGQDVTEAFRRGAAHAVLIASTVGARRAVLKARSPSCGCHEVFDGSFGGTLRAGAGVTAAALEGAGVAVFDEEDVAEGRLG